MEDQNIQLEQLVSRVAENHKRTFRRSMIFSVLALLAGAVWLFYSFNQVRKLDLKSDQLAREITIKGEELKQEEKKLQEAQVALSAINPFLKKYVLKEKWTADNINSNLVKQSLEANQEIQTVLSRDVGRRGYTVDYFKKDSDPEKVEAALKEFGFKFETKAPHRPNDPTDVVAFGEKVSPEDAKLVAYTLVRAGVEVKSLCRARYGGPAIIQVLGDNRFRDRPAMTVDQIRGKTEFQACPDYTKPLPNEL